jgi:hypothetical protein
VHERREPVRPSGPHGLGRLERQQRPAHDEGAGGPGAQQLLDERLRRQAAAVAASGQPTRAAKAVPAASACAAVAKSSAQL